VIEACQRLERFPVACATASPKGGVPAQHPMVQRSSSNRETLYENSENRSPQSVSKEWVFYFKRKRQ
jgi:hypothetical protein